MYSIQEYYNSVYSFKSNWCDENTIIPQILKEQLSEFLNEPILDVGAGLGDIANQAFPDKKAVCLDLQLPNDSKVLNNPNHRWVQCDFFDFAPSCTIKTILICHTQQFLDEDMARLNEKVHQIGPKHVVLVSNVNDGLFGRIVSWTLENYPESNPEIRHKEFPTGYDLIKSISFSAQLRCDTFETLVEQISYLMVIKTQEYRNSLILFLRKILSEPHLEINEIIEVYERNS